jgi:hypothetical protein
VMGVWCCVISFSAFIGKHQIPTDSKTTEK